MCVAHHFSKMAIRNIYHNVCIFIYISHMHKAVSHIICIHIHIHITYTHMRTYYDFFLCHTHQFTIPLSGALVHIKNEVVKRPRFSYSWLRTLLRSTYKTRRVGHCAFILNRPPTTMRVAQGEGVMCTPCPKVASPATPSGRSLLLCARLHALCSRAYVGPTGRRAGR